MTDHSKKPTVAPSGVSANLLDELVQNPHLLLIALTPDIVFKPIYVDLAGSVTAGLLLSMAVDVPGSEDWTVLDTPRILRATRMTLSELRGARQRLKETNLIEERRSGFPARTEFKVNFDAIKAGIVALSRAKQGSDHQESELVLEAMAELENHQTTH